MRFERSQGSKGAFHVGPFASEMKAGSAPDPICQGFPHMRIVLDNADLYCHKILLAYLFTNRLSHIYGTSCRSRFHYNLEGYAGSLAQRGIPAAGTTNFFHALLHIEQAVPRRGAQIVG